MPDFNVSTALPDLTLREQTVITVDTGDPSATVTSLVIHVAQGAPVGGTDLSGLGDSDVSWVWGDEPVSV